ncbi:hypothetical protein [Roseibium sp. RKSG952]|uniref:hypothetical protein n=1 Tax=Roseibium sp. RKSG952 TaxID=2529384 RepID=UPI0012BB90C5|nr:hypothetical protein [Roseibium sp. RKSG952]MTH97299.1 hypothetical protein [Roseibium sp. RKSG952]
MDTAATSSAEFVHVRIIMGMVVGLGMARLMNGLALFVQHPGKIPIYSVHLGWSLYMLLGVTFFWWFEFALVSVDTWTFESYLFHIFFAAIYFFISAVLYPEKMEEYSGYKDYFLRRRAWIYSLLAVLFLVDVADTRLKGIEHFQELGPSYLVRQLAIVALVLSAIRVERSGYHVFVVGVVLLSQVWLIVSAFSAIS